MYASLQAIPYLNFQMMYSGIPLRFKSMLTNGMLLQSHNNDYNTDFFLRTTHIKLKAKKKGKCRS